MNHPQYTITLELPSSHSLLQERCTGCLESHSMFEVEHVDRQTLCQRCFRNYLPALKIEEETTQPWTIRAVSEADYQAQLVTRQTLYRERLAAL